MVFSDLEVYFRDKWLNFTIKADNIDGFREGDFVKIISDGMACVSKPNTYGRPILTSGRFLSEKQQLDFENNSIGKYYCQIDSIKNDLMSINMIYDMQINYAKDIDEDGICIAILDNAVERSSVEELNQILESNYKINMDGQDFYLFGLHKNAQDKKNTFILIDALNRKYFSVAEKTIYEINHDFEAASEVAYSIERGESSLRNADQYSIWLYDGNINFNDSTTVKKCSIHMKSFVESKGDEYIRRWRSYAEAEFNIERERSQRAGYLVYDRYETVDKENSIYKFYLENMDSLVSFVKNGEAIKDEEGNIPVRIVRGKRGMPAKLLVDGIDKKEKSVPIKTNEGSFPYRNGATIEIDLSGAKMMYERRMEAFDRIEGVDGKKAANVCVAALLEGKKFNLYQSKKLNNKFRVDEQIIRQYFTKDGVDYPPNDSQYRAIEIALNTPDFAIIQGPPGTGKTKVINAIYAHMQKYEKDANISNGKILLTAYQRDATANLTKEYDGRFGLPIIAYYGNKEGTDESLRNWRNHICSEFLDKHGEITMASAVKDAVYSVKSLRNSFVKKCQLTRLSDILDQIIAVSYNFYEILEEIKKQEDVIEEKIEFTTDNNFLLNSITRLKSKKNIVFSHLLNKKESSSKKNWRTYVKLLPISKREFSDNGLESIKRVVNYLEGLKIDEIAEDVDILKKIIELGNIDKEEVKALKEVKINLIYELNRENQIKPEEKEEFVNLINDIIEGMKKYKINDRQGILSDYFDALSSDVELTKTIPIYQEIIAATHQKSLIEDEGGVHNYKDVLIDEAARSCPADMMISLSCAENRMILVGDHNQLPQFVGEGVLRRLITEKTENELYDSFTKEADKDTIEEMYKSSMFQYLLDKVKKLEEQDGHPRFVQLNEQYRMAPKIGDIVADNFYSKKGKRTLFNGINNDAAYQQNFTGIGGKNLIWVNMPTKLGDEEQTDTKSRYRTCESKVIVDYVANMYDELKEDEKIGIITFYKGQEKSIKKWLKRRLGKDLAEINEKVEVGTVDAFQGKEFVVVFLSLVITNKENRIGFLDSRNRMCVALSRAKKCLVVVGNDDILNYKYRDKVGNEWKLFDAAEELKSLVDIRDYCLREVGGVCEYRTKESVDRL